MSDEQMPKPEVMPVDAKEWVRKLNLSNFVNSYYQYRDIESLPNVQRILIIGPGQGLDTSVFKWRGYSVITFDIDDTFKPDVIGSVHNLSMFGDRSFDAVIASHVIEHLPPSYLNDALRELARVATYALIYLPVAGRPMEISFSPGIRGWRWSLPFHLFNWFKRPSAKQPLFCGGQHYWEIARPGFRRAQVARRLARHFLILKQYRNKDWLFSYNFVLKAR